MDTSPEYINMCRKATELQEMWEPKEGDFYVRDGYPVGAYCTDYFIYYVTEDEDEWKIKVTWLPRIDQLIEMFPLGWKAMLQDILNFVKPGDTPSIESECIKAIMYYNHDKSWNGEDWI